MTRMKRFQTHSKTCPDEEFIRVPTDFFLESLPVGGALIGPDYKVLGTNSRLAQIVGPTNSRPCYESLAGISTPCPFCPFQDIISGRLVSIQDQIHVRHGHECSVDVRFLSSTQNHGLVLETVRDLAGDDPCLTLPAKSPGMPRPFLEKLTGLLSISRDLLGSAPLREKMSHVFDHLQAAFSDRAETMVWAEIDDHTFGKRPDRIKGLLFSQEIVVEGKVRGELYVSCPSLETSLPEEQYFVEEVVHLIGRQLEIFELEAMLRRSEERYKKLTGNLRQEMWTRTEALAKETGYLEGILRSSQDMIVTTDLNSRIVEFNPGAEKMVGYTAEEMQGKKIGDIWVDPEERERIVQEITTTGGVKNYETKLRTKNGEIREISLTLSLLKDEEGRILGTVGVSKDIGKENAIRRELERLNQNYRETINFISHETKNSLIVIAGFVGRLLEKEADPTRKAQLEIVYHHAKFLEAMSKDFLVMSELEFEGLHFRKDKIENFFEQVIFPAMIGLKERYPDSFQSYDESMGGVGAIQLMGSQGHLEIVYRNLFGNALKYRSPGGKIAYGVVEYADRYIFNVWNEGPGVTYDQVEKIFDKFYRVQDETTREKRGTGLGLYNIRKIIEAHEGKIWCETKPGEWINFLFSLPKN
jgi:PAS domain S-box-containing protein